ncbi:hypothetical protein [uncultured Nostoc sp.]|uniref:hypothetical protein n=1 Tax=uncultured Nostoc sp. TaxID=340711 RepID=UPI0035CC2010
MPTPQELCLIRLCKLDVFQLTTSKKLALKIDLAITVLNCSSHFMQVDIQLPDDLAPL